MHLRLKVIVLVALLFAVLVAVEVVIEQRLVMPSFSRLEQSHAQTSLTRVRYAVDRTLEELLVTSMDWSNWADAYRFVQDHNPEFARVNITRASMKTLQVDAILIVDLDGHIVLNSGKVVQTPLSLESGIIRSDSLRADFPWRKFLGTMTPARGLVKTNQGVLMISGTPVLNGTGGGRPMGMVIMGRLLTPERLHRVGSQTQSTIALAEGRPPAPSDAFFETESLTQAYGPFQDVYQRPVMTLRVDVPREITASGRVAVQYASASLLAAAVVVLVLLLVLLNRLVLAPLTRMTRHAAAIGTGADLTARLNSPSRDEFGQLAREFDAMVERLSDARRQLADRSFQAGFAEMAKGVLHNLGNALTPLGVRLTSMERRLRSAPIADLEAAATELVAGIEDTERRAALTEFLLLGSRELGVIAREAGDDISVMQRQTAMMRASLSEQMHASAHSSPVLESVRLPDLIQQSLEIVPDSSRQRLQVHSDESLQAIGTVQLARNVLRLVLQNLIINAADAVRDSGKDRGTLRVAARIVREGDQQQLYLQCQDDGVGIPNENLERVFEQGFSTKSPATNHGIGLHWCANAVRALGGRIWAASDGRGHGASMHLMLPLAQ